jgi:hypothetical protein
LDGSGSFSSLAACQNNCGPDPIPGLGYDCESGFGCYPHAGAGTGQYPTLAACQAACRSEDLLQTMPPPEEPEDTGY